MTRSSWTGVFLSFLMVFLLTEFEAHAAQSASTHDHGARAKLTLQLDRGQKWAADATLKGVMTAIREKRKVAISLPASMKAPARYSDLAYTIKTQVKYAFSHCKLTPAADANAHVILAQLLSGSNRLSSNSEKMVHLGLAEVDEAIRNYTNYFAEP